MLHFGRVLLLLSFEALTGALLDLCLGRIDGQQTLLASRDLGRHVHAIGHAHTVGLLAQRQQGLHFFVQLGFDLVRVGPRQGFVLARVGVNLGAVQRDTAQLQALHLARQHQHLYKQRLHLRQETPPEGGDRVVVGVGVGRNEPECHRVVGGTLDLA